MTRLLVLAALVAVVAPSATASDRTGFAFGRTGGSIRPFAVVIAVDGAVRTSGAVEARHAKLTRLQLGRLNQLAVTTGFAKLDKQTLCSGTLPDIATTYIRVGPRVVHVHGDCVPAYRKLWAALRNAAGVNY
jgi:hypothetical protein